MKESNETLLNKGAVSLVNRYSNDEEELSKKVTESNFKNYNSIKKKSISVKKIRINSLNNILNNFK